MRSSVIRSAALWLLLGCAGRQTPHAGMPDDTGVVPLIDEREYRTEPAAPAQNRRTPEEVEPEVVPEAPETEEAPVPAVEVKDQEPAPAGEAQPAVPYAGPRGAIRRAELVRFLERPPAVFLRNVTSEPRFEGGRFRGWTLMSFFPGDPRFTGIDLRQGDVILRVNGHPIEQPDQFIFVWQELRQAKELRVDLLRSGKPHVSRWTIAD